MPSSFCWWCGRALQGPGVPVSDPVGNEHEVHKVCKAAAQGSFTQEMHVEEKRWSSFDSIDEDD